LSVVKWSRFSGRSEHFQPLEVTIVWEKDPGADAEQEVESLREFLGELIHCVGEAPILEGRRMWFGVGQNGLSKHDTYSQYRLKGVLVMSRVNVSIVCLLRSHNTCSTCFGRDSC